VNVIVLAALGGVGVLTVIQVWAYRASPSWMAKRIARHDPTVRAMSAATFRRRLLFYYGATLLFIAIWLGHALILAHRAAELQRVIDGTSDR
jgi:hypothetical protein